MDLKHKRKCDKCKSLFSVAPFENMVGNGEKAYSRVVIYGDSYDLCPDCTKKLYNFVNNK